MGSEVLHALEIFQKPRVVKGVEACRIYSGQSNKQSSSKAGLPVLSGEFLRTMLLPPPANFYFLAQTMSQNALGNTSQTTANGTERHSVPECDILPPLPNDVFYFTGSLPLVATHLFCVLLFRPLRAFNESPHGTTKHLRHCLRGKGFCVIGALELDERVGVDRIPTAPIGPPELWSTLLETNPFSLWDVACNGPFPSLGNIWDGWFY